MSCSLRFCRRFGRWAKGSSDDRADDHAGSAEPGEAEGEGPDHRAPARSGQEQRLGAADPLAVEDSGDGLVDELPLTREDSNRSATDSLGVLGIEVEPREAPLDKMMASRYFSAREHKARSARRWASLALCSSVGGVAVDLITVSVKLPDLPEFRTEPLALIVAGLVEPLSPLVPGMALLSTTALVCALGPRRLRRLS